MSLNARKARATGYAVTSLVGAFALAVLMVAGATKWFPEGRAGIDHIIVPIILFPLVWIALAVFLYATPRRARAWTIVGAVAVAHVGLVAYGFLT